MLSVTIGLILLGQNQPQNVSSSKAGEIVSKMIANYAEAKTLTGIVNYTLKAPTGVAKVETTLHLSRPDNKLYLKQIYHRVQGNREWLITCDGTNFSYDAPSELLTKPGERLIEPLKQNGQKLDVRDAYAIAARGLVDRSAVLDILIARLDDLKYVRSQWASLNLMESSDNNIHIVTGYWREYGNASITGEYKMWITPQNELKRYIYTETVTPDPKVGAQQLEHIWDLNVTLGGKVDQALFKLAK